MRSVRVVSLCLCLLASAAAEAQEAALGEIVGMIETGQLERAEQALRARLEASPGIEERDLLGVVLSRQGRLQEAEREFLDVMRLDRSRLSTHQNLGRLYLMQERRGEALEVLRRASRLGELDRELAFGLATLEASAGDVSAAQVQLASFVERFDSVRARLLLARLQGGAGDLPSALRTLEEVLERAPHSEAALETYARLSLEANVPVAAVLALDSLTRMYPLEPRHAYLSGVARLQARDIDGAVEALRTALELEPQRVSTVVALGLALNTQKGFEEARGLLRFGVQLDPDNVDALAGLAEAEAGLSNLEEAERYCQQTLRMSAEHPVANLTLGMVRMKQGRYEEARDSLEQALIKDPGSPKTHYQLSLAYARLGDRERSKQHLESYQQALDAYEESVRLLESQTGRASGGMSSRGG